MARAPEADTVSWISYSSQFGRHNYVEVPFHSCFFYTSISNVLFTMSLAMKLRFHPRFSLRTFLLVITALAVWLGVIVSRAQRQRSAVETITKLRGSVYYDYQLSKLGTTITLPGSRPTLTNGSVMTWGPSTITISNERQSYLVGRLTASSPVPRWLSELIGDEMFVDVIAVHLNDSELTNDDLQCLSGLPDIRVLDLSRTKITDHAIAHLASLRKLESLALDGTLIEGPGLVHLQSLQLLDNLTLANTRITDEGLDQIVAPQRLIGIALDNTEVGDAGLAYLCSARQLEIVSLSGTNVNGTGLRNLGDAEIEVLRLAHTPITEEGLAGLASWPKLRILALEHSSLTDAGVEHLKALTQLETLQLPWVAHQSSNITADAARGIEQALPNTNVIYPP